MIKKKLLETTSQELFAYLNEMLQDSKFPTRTFYGETFTALGMYILDGKNYSKKIEKILDSYYSRNKEYDNFHWEFNNYALLNLYKVSGNKNIIDNIFPLKFKNTSCTNWTILRGISRMLASKKYLLGIYELKKKIILMQNENGFIKDDINSKSFQYHCFSMSLIAEAYELTGINFFKKSFLKAVDFISNFILSNGDTNYIGRGQEQIFGYGPLIYSLEYAYKLTGERIYKSRQSKVMNFLLEFKNEDGSFPLVLRKGEKAFPKKVNVNNTDYLGWYNYNNYFDYLPFLGYFLVKTLNIFNEIDQSKRNFLLGNKNYSDENYFVFRNKNYEAVISKPGGNWSNDLPLPYICYKNKVITPCFGGEEYGSNLYSVNAIPLPKAKIISSQINLREKVGVFIWKLKRLRLKNFKTIIKDIFSNKIIKRDYFFRNELNYELDKNKIIGESYQIKHIRNFDFLLNEIRIKDIILFKNNIFFEKLYILNLFFYNISEEYKGKYVSKKNNIEFIIELGEGEDIKLLKNGYYGPLGKLNSLQKSIENKRFTKGEYLELNFKLILKENHDE